MVAVGKTDVGRLRANNEDSFFVCANTIGGLPNLFIVADGMGGHKAGEIASRSAIDFFLQYINRNDCSDGELLDFITEAAAFANSQVYKKSLADPHYHGMGTTLSACVISNGRAYISHIGDSRVYLASSAKLRQLTNDHTYVSEMVRAGQFSREEARHHPRKNALTRALGVEESVQVDARIDRVLPGDWILLCSDGLTNMVSDEEINKILLSGADIQSKADTFIDRAKENGGVDNITVVIIRVKE